MLLVVFIAVVVSFAWTLRGVVEKGNHFPAPSQSALSGLNLRQRIVAIVDSQVGYKTDPANSYCNKFSSFWHAGTQNCPSGESSEEWCADFAAWAWRVAGVHINYGYNRDELNGGAASFYNWGVDNGEWHPATNGYVAAPGDVAIYGLSAGPNPLAMHVAVVTEDAPGQRGPDVVNGDGDLTDFSVVETETDQFVVHADHHTFTLDGYVSPK